MVRASSFAGVILAAGESSRMGRDKALLPWPASRASQTTASETFLSASIRLLNSVCDFVVVVVGKNRNLLAPAIYSEGASMAVNSDPSRGQFSSLQIGLNEVLDRGRDGAVITLVDRPPVKRATLQQLLSAYDNADPKIWSVVPEFSGRHGHPFVIGREMIEAFLRVPATLTARDVEQEHRDRILYVSVDDPLIAVNVNTPAEYEELSRPRG